MTTVINKMPSVEWHVDADAPNPLIWWLRPVAGDPPEARASTLVCVITDGTTTLTKSVGSGITLSTYETVANAQVTLQLTAAELAAFPLGNFTRFEFREGASDPKTLIFKGRMVLE